MRASFGLGFITAVGLIACASSSDDPSKPAASSQTSDGDPKGIYTTTTDPTDPPAETTTPPAPARAPDDPETPPGPIVEGLTITDVAAFQAVKVPVVRTGALVNTTARSAPVVAKRPGLIRVYVTPASGWQPRDVTAELRLVQGNKKFPILRDTKRITGASKEEDPTSTFNLDVPAESLPVGVTFQVSLTAEGGEKAPTGDRDGRFPRDGSFQDLGAQLSGKLKVVVVPIQYDADGSGRTPDTSATQLELYKKTLMSWYPISEIEVTTHQPYSWTTAISSNGNGFQQVLRAMTQLRQQDNVASDVYYYGAFSPGATFDGYCRGGCVTGLSTIVDADSAPMRASVGVGFSGKLAAETMGHELGHAHGRQHAPCGGPSGVDPQYPYQQAQIGVWGYSIFDKTFIPPTKGRDMMAYCPNQWVSDYTYRALFERVSVVSLAKDFAFAAPSGAPADAASFAKKNYRIAMVDGEGSLAWDGDIDVSEELVGGAVNKANFIAASGAPMVSRDAHFYKFDHLPGGFLFVPSEVKVDWKTVEISGFGRKLAR